MRVVWSGHKNSFFSFSLPLLAAIPDATFLFLFVFLIPYSRAQLLRAWLYRFAISFTFAVCESSFYTFLVFF